jgi:hypothetical protein
MNQYHLLSLPRELIYKIAAANASVYNCILRLCRTAASLFPLSVRLDFMEAFGVGAELCTWRDDLSIIWYWNELSHDVWGPAFTYKDGSVSHYYKDVLHSATGPACIWTDHCISWYIRGIRHRDSTAPSGTDVEWLDGAAGIDYDVEYITVSWHHRGGFVRELTYAAGTTEYAQARAEMDWWIAREHQ